MQEHSPQHDDYLKNRDDGNDSVGSIETSIADGFTITAVSDFIVSRPLKKGDLQLGRTA